MAPEDLQERTIHEADVLGIADRYVENKINVGDIWSEPNYNKKSLIVCITPEDDTFNTLEIIPKGGSSILSNCPLEENTILLTWYGIQREDLAKLHTNKAYFIESCPVLIDATNYQMYFDKLKDAGLTK